MMRPICRRESHTLTHTHTHPRTHTHTHRSDIKERDGSSHDSSEQSLVDDSGGPHSTIGVQESSEQSEHLCVCVCVCVEGGKS